MAITLADFNKIWASTSPLTPYSFSESNYKQGWNFIGSTPPARQMWDFLQKNNDEKMQYLANNYLPLSGGTMTGVITSTTYTLAQRNTDDSYIGFNGGSDNNNGARIALSGKDRGSGLAGIFEIFANDVTNKKGLVGKPDGTLTWGGQPLLPIGIVQAFAGTTIPTGWLLCDGSAVSRTTYAGLFAVIGTTYGAGNGSTTFNLPNLTDKFVEGSSTAGTIKSAGLPNITGSYKYREAAGVDVNTDFSGAITGGGYVGENDGNLLSQTSTSSTRKKLLTFNASNSNSIYGNSTTVQPPAVTMRYIIKY